MLLSYTWNSLHTERHTPYTHMCTHAHRYAHTHTHMHTHAYAIHTQWAPQEHGSHFPLCVLGPSTVSANTRYCLLNGIKDSWCGASERMRNCKILILAMLDFSRQTTEILLCPLLISIGKKSMSEAEDDFWLSKCLRTWKNLVGPMVGTAGKSHGQNISPLWGLKEAHVNFRALYQGFLLTVEKLVGRTMVPWGRLYPNFQNLWCGKGEFTLLVSWHANRGLVLDYLSVLSVISRVLKSGKGRPKRQRHSDLVWGFYWPLLALKTEGGA